MTTSVFRIRQFREVCTLVVLVAAVCLAYSLISDLPVWSSPVSWGDLDVKLVAHCFESTASMTPAVFRIRRLHEVCSLTGLSRTTIWRKTRAGTFPKPMMLSERTPGWAEQDLVNYLEERRAAAGLPKLVDAA